MQAKAISKGIPVKRQKAIGLLLNVMSILPSRENDSTRPLVSHVIDMSQQGMARMIAPIIYCFGGDFLNPRGIVCGFYFYEP